MVVKAGKIEVPEGMCGVAVKEFSPFDGRSVLQTLCGKVESLFFHADPPRGECVCGKPLFVAENELPLGYLECLRGEAPLLSV